MQTLLVISKDSQKAFDYIMDFCKKNSTDRIDIDINHYEKAIGIEDIRNLQKKIILRPIRSKTKAVVIDTVNGLTLQAQNSMLKMLEEPPSNTIVVLYGLTKEIFLSTIISRCNIINLKDDKQELSKEEKQEYIQILNLLFVGGTSDKLRLAADITKDKKDAILWLEKMIIASRCKLIEDYENSKLLNLSKSFQETYKLLKSTNVNQRFVLENLFLSV